MTMETKKCRVASFFYGLAAVVGRRQQMGVVLYRLTVPATAASGIASPMCGAG